MYVDDWGATSDSDRQKMLQSCADERCAHPRYQHGRVTLGFQGRFESLAPGPCRRCTCVTFWEAPPILVNDILDIIDTLKGEKVTLELLGIPPLVYCTAQKTAMAEFGDIVQVFLCSDERNHKGDHRFGRSQ